MQAESSLLLLMVNGVRKGLPDIYPLFKAYMLISKQLIPFKCYFA